MLAAPFIISAARPVAEAVVRSRGRAAVEVLPHEKRGISELADHAIIIGYGLAGRHLARVLRAAGFSYVILEQNGQLVRTGRQAGEPVFFGDGTRREVLERVHIDRARVLVFSISSPADERRGVAVAREQNPSLPIIVRTRYVAAIEELRRLGATDVVVEEFEAALELFAKVLERYQIPLETVHEEVEAVRGETYGLFRGAQPSADIRLDPLYHLRVHDALEIVDVAETAPAVDESPVSLDLRKKTGAVIIAVVRDGEAHYTPDTSFRFEPLDTVVLVGDPEALDRARNVFQSPPKPVE
jgi:CPA2 family monovalent cation:H+ antiporter-2